MGDHAAGGFRRRARGRSADGNAAAQRPCQGSQPPQADSLAEPSPPSEASAAPSGSALLDEPDSVSLSPIASSVPDLVSVLLADSSTASKPCSVESSVAGGPAGSSRSSTDTAPPLDS